ncbi:MAG: hypothetical protein PWQ91_1539 [Eubacteriales bacterium]|nr:hypothetical protein [Eubacteriales bacterium]
MPYTVSYLLFLLILLFALFGLILVMFFYKVLLHLRRGEEEKKRQELLSALLNFLSEGTEFALSPKQYPLLAEILTAELAFLGGEERERLLDFLKAKGFYSYLLEEIEKRKGVRFLRALRVFSSFGSREDLGFLLTLMERKGEKYFPDLAVAFLRLLNTIEMENKGSFLAAFLDMLLKRLSLFSFALRREVQFLLTGLKEEAAAVVMERVQRMLLTSPPELLSFSLDLLGKRSREKGSAQREIDQLLFLLDVLGEIALPEGEFLAKKLLTHPEAEVRARACRLAAAVGSAGAFCVADGRERECLAPAYLVSCLKDPAPAVRVRCAHALAVLQIEEALPHLASALADRVYYVRDAAMRALYAYRWRAFPYLWQVVKEGKDPFARDKALECFQLYDNFLLLVEGSRGLNHLDPCFCREILAVLEAEAGEVFKRRLAELAPTFPPEGESYYAVVH